MNSPRREGTAAENPPGAALPPATATQSSRGQQLRGTACPQPVSPCPPGRPAPSPSQHGMRLLDLELSGRHQQEPPYRISFGFHRAVISSLLSCGQKRGHKSANSTARPSRPLGFLGAPPVPAGALLTVHTPPPSTALGAAAWPHLSSWRTRLRSRSRAARSSSLSGLADKQPCQHQPMAAPQLLFRKTEQPPSSPSGTCFLLFFLQQQQQQTASMIRIIPPTTDIAMIRASKFTAGCKERHSAHKYPAAEKLQRLQPRRCCYWTRGKPGVISRCTSTSQTLRASFMVWLRQPAPHPMPTWGISPGIWVSRWQPASSLQSIASVPRSRVVPHWSPRNGQVQVGL